MTAIEADFEARALAASSTESDDVAEELLDLPAGIPITGAQPRVRPDQRTRRPSSRRRSSCRSSSGSRAASSTTCATPRRATGSTTWRTSSTRTAAGSATASSSPRRWRCWRGSLGIPARVAVGFLRPAADRGGHLRVQHPRPARLARAVLRGRGLGALRADARGPGTGEPPGYTLEHLQRPQPVAGPVELALVERREPVGRAHPSARSSPARRAGPTRTATRTPASPGCQWAVVSPARCWSVSPSSGPAAYVAAAGSTASKVGRSRPGRSSGRPRPTCGCPGPTPGLPGRPGTGWPSSSARPRSPIDGSVRPTARRLSPEAVAGPGQDRPRARAAALLPDRERRGGRAARRRAALRRGAEGGRPAASPPTGSVVAAVAGAPHARRRRGPGARAGQVRRSRRAHLTEFCEVRWADGARARAETR